ncbi:MAG: GNAT family N-acetyltransferase [Chloroflexota bacterium]
MKALPKVLEPLETERLYLRSMNTNDVEVMRYASDDPFPESATIMVMLASVEQLLSEGRSLEWGIVEKHSSKLIGTCGLHSFEPEIGSAEVGCMLARKAWGNGYMREALGSVLAYAHQILALTRLRADIDHPNTRSIRLFK